MQWWTNFLDWLSSDAGWRIVSGAVIPFLAIVVAGIVAASIGRGSAKRVIALSDREVKASAVTALISAARKAAVWNTLPVPEQQHIDHLIGDADIRLRLLPVPGTALAADWASHEIISMKRNAVSFSFQAEQSLVVFRDRMIDWQARPNRAKRLFKNDLDSWAYDSSLSEQELVHQQQAWAAAQVAKTGPIDTVTAAAVAVPTVAATVTPPASKPFAQSRFTRPAAVAVPVPETALEQSGQVILPVELAPVEPEPAAAAAAEPEPAVEPAEPAAAVVAETASLEPSQPTSAESDRGQFARGQFARSQEDFASNRNDPGGDNHAETVEHELVEPEQAEQLPEIVVHEHEYEHGLPALAEPTPEEPRDVSEASVFAPVAEENRHDEHGHDENRNDENNHDEHRHDHQEHHQQH